MDRLCNNDSLFCLCPWYWMGTKTLYEGRKCFSGSWAFNAGVGGRISLYFNQSGCPGSNGDDKLRGKIRNDDHSVLLDWCNPRNGIFSSFYDAFLLRLKSTFGT